MIESSTADDPIVISDDEDEIDPIADDVLVVPNDEPLVVVTTEATPETPDVEDAPTLLATWSRGADPLNPRPDDFIGVAPDAGIVSVTVADNSGAVDVSQVIAAIDWVVQNRQANGRNIGVLSLSYNPTSTQSPLLDPLSKAVENAWNHGIVVVVSAGNEGRSAKTLASPATHPYVIAVSSTKLDDEGFGIPSWAPSGDRVRNPDLLAPGDSIASLRNPGSRIDLENPKARRRRRPTFPRVRNVAVCSRRRRFGRPAAGPATRPDARPGRGDSQDQRHRSRDACEVPGQRRDRSLSGDESADLTSVRPEPQAGDRARTSRGCSRERSRHARRRAPRRRSHRQRKCVGWPGLGRSKRAANTWSIDSSLSGWSRSGWSWSGWSWSGSSWSGSSWS